MRAINVVNHAGSIADAVKQGVLKHGIMHDCVANKVDFSSPARSATTARYPTG